MARIGTLLLVLVLLSGCGPREPLRIGFIGGLSGRVADLGEAGRNGVQIAIEEINRAGGVKGRQIELLVRDDAQSPEKAIAAVNELIAARVEAIIGPMTSAMAEVVLPLAQRAGVVLVSPTVTAHNFFGIDDMLFLIMSSTRVEAESSAEYHFTQSAVRHVVAIHDARNRAYTESWLRDFTVGFQARGGDVVPVAFESGPDVDSGAIVRKALAQRPDAILLITGAFDAARLAQNIRESDPGILLFAAQWASTERLIEFGGKAVDGMVLHSYFDHDSKAPGMLRLHQAYRERFQREPGFAGVAAYDAAHVVLEGLARQSGGQALRDALLTRGPFVGAEENIIFDGNGDSRRIPHITVVRDGHFVTLR
ncbi:MAG TPA: ABC transporter substrate-binding protein [Azonexus sp.]|jgi:branched-chain amino acid transport system substrate-binding protein